MGDKEQVNNEHVDIFELIDSICAEFRQRWKDGHRPRIEDCLKDVPENARGNLFKNLLLLDIRYRERLGETPTPNDYETRFPDFKRFVADAFHQSTSISIERGQGKSPAESVHSIPVTIDQPTLRRVGDYELVKELGRGGFGIVYEARHVRRGHHVALKLLRTGSDEQEVNPDRLYKFRREFRSLSEINHPNLVGMQSLEVDGERWSFTMDLIEGVDFLSYVRKGDNFDESRLRSAFNQLVRGIVALHDRGIVHRDLKPSNVMVDRNGRLVILDFGLVAHLQKATDQTASLQSAMFAGTPLYAAPEQMFGERSEASDWYAAGTMLFEALTDVSPFQGTQIELMRQKQEEDPPLLANRNGLPSDLCELADGLISRDPKQRPSAQQITQVLEIEGETRSFSSAGVSSTNDEEDPELVASLDEEVILVGREAQLRQLNENYQEFLKSRAPRVTWITGLSGEGKSVLAEKFLRPLRRGNSALVLTGRCYDRESVPFKAIDSIIPPLVSFLRTQRTLDVEGMLPEDIVFLARLFPLLRRVEPIAALMTADLSSVDSDKVKFRGFQAFRELLGKLADRMSLVIAIDDLQWADLDSAQVLFDLTHGVDPPTLMLIGSYRSDEATESPFLTDWHRLAQGNGSFGDQEIVNVEPLTREQCIELACIRTGLNRTELVARADEMLGDSGGNPYFVEQLLDGFNVETGQLDRVPIAELIDARLAKLPPEATPLLEVVSVSGQPITLEEASSSAGFNEVALSTATHMRSERLLRILGSDDGSRIDTYHDKIRETVLERMTPKRRADVHLQIAEAMEHQEPAKSQEWLEELSRDSRIGEYERPVSHRVVDLAHHFHAAGDVRAFPYQLLAAEAAYLSYAVDEARVLYEKATEGLPDSASSNLRYRLTLANGLVQKWNRETNRAIDLLWKAVEHATSSRDKAIAFSGVAGVHRQLGQYRTSIEIDKQAYECLSVRVAKGSVGSFFSALTSHLRILALPSRWIMASTFERKSKYELLSVLGDLAGQDSVEASAFLAWEVQSRQALSAIRTGRPDLVALGYFIASNGWGTFGFHQVARRLLNRADAIESPEESPGVEAARGYFRGLAYYWQGDLRESDVTFARAEEINRRLHNTVNIQVCRHMRRHIMAFVNTTSAELNIARSVVEVSSRSENPQGLCWGYYDIACAEVRAGNIETALSWIQKSFCVLGDQGFAMTEPIRDSSAAFVCLQASNYEDCCSFAKNALASIAKSLVAFDCSLYSLPLLVEGLAGPQWLSDSEPVDRSEIKRAMRRVAIFYYNLPNHQPHLLRVMGRAFWRLGRHRKAIRRFEKAIMLAEKKGMDYQRAKCLLDLAAVKEDDRETNRTVAIELLKKMESVIPRAESWLLGDQYDEEVVAPEFDMNAWKTEHGNLGPPP